MSAGPSRTLERILAGLFVVGWGWAGAIELSGAWPGFSISLYQLFGAAATGGWLSGNVWLWRARRELATRATFFVLFAGPPGYLAVLARAVPVGPGESGDHLGLVATGVFAMLFLVPVTLGRLPRGRTDGQR